MPLYKLTGDAIQPVARTSLGAAGLRERRDLQRLLKRHIEVLAIDRDANLVVIELKRDQSSHMELQALRNAEACVGAARTALGLWGQGGERSPEARRGHWLQRSLAYRDSVLPARCSASASSAS